eukprot:6770725-Pyramimonas_sp.AAC.1
MATFSKTPDWVPGKCIAECIDMERFADANRCPSLACAWQRQFTYANRCPSLACVWQHQFTDAKRCPSL